MNTCYGIRLHSSTLVDGRKVPVSNYYVGRGKDGPRTCNKPHNAALLSEALAEALATKLNNTGHHGEVAELLAGETSTIHDSLVDIGDAYGRLESWYGVLVRLSDYTGVSRTYGGMPTR